MTGNTSVDRFHIEAAGNLLICQENEGDEREQQFQTLAKTAKQEGSLVILQLVHPGNLTPTLINPNPLVVNGSDENVIREVVNRFVYSAQQVLIVICLKTIS